ncbi:MAG TPA: alpha/beta hydrolase [Pseudolabrys sp.]|nr:alpha/beta hydrolase [Pseudolabrys sp.]
MSDAAKFLIIDGRRLAYREVGAGPPIVFLHGLGGNSESWQPQFAAFSDRYRLVAWDMPGFGASEPVPLATTRDYSTLARRFMDALAIERAVGVGTSYGTVILADLAAANPGRIGAMVFACGVTGTGHLDGQERARLRAERRAVLESIGQRTFAEQRNATYVKGGGAALVAKVVDLAGSATTEGYLQAYGAMTESNIFDSLAAIRIPALVLSGRDDPIAKPTDCERAARALPQADYHCIDTCGHYVNLEQAETFNSLLADFLARAA